MSAKGTRDSMSDVHVRQKQLETALELLASPPGITLRSWTEADFPAIQRLSSAEGWPTPQQRPDEALSAWQHSWPTLVLTEDEHDQVIGFVRSLSDGEVTTFIAELLVAPEHRGKGLGRLLLDACHLLYPHTRLDLISDEKAVPFYKAIGFRYVGEGVRKSYR